MTIRNTILFASASVLVAFSLGATPQPADRNQAAILELMNERKQLLERMVEVVRWKFEQGECVIDEVIVAERELLDARLELAATQTQRIAILESQLELARNLETQVARSVDHGHLDPPSLLRAKADRLQAEIELLREKHR